MKKLKYNLKTEIKRAYKKTDQFKIETLIMELKKWQRREKISNNKIRLIQKKINKLAVNFSQRKGN